MAEDFRTIKEKKAEGTPFTNGLFFGLFILLVFAYVEPPKDLSYSAWLTAGVALLMTIWWVTEAIPIYFTGVIPLILFPTLNIYDLNLLAGSYAHPLVLLFLGGFIIASSIDSTVPLSAVIVLLEPSGRLLNIFISKKKFSSLICSLLPT